MRAFNKTKNRTITEDVIVAGTLEEKSVGLTKYASPRAMYFETRWGACSIPSAKHKTAGEKIKHFFRNIIHPIVDSPLLWCGVHTFGMKFSIDVAVLDEENSVVALKKNMPPGHVFFWNPRWKKIIEFPAGSGVEMGDKLKFSE